MIGYSMDAMNVCFSCKKELSMENKAGRRDECPFCGVDLHCCLNCRFYDRAAPRQCREPVAELVREKEKANFCDYFVFAEGDRAGSPESGTEKARQQLDDLFKK